MKESLDAKLVEELKKIKQDMEQDKEEALGAATDHAKTMLTEELENLKNTHATELAAALDDALTKLKNEHAEETTQLTAKHGEELAKASGDMKVLSDAHSAKTSALETAIAEAKAYQQAAEEKARRIPDLETTIEFKSKELEEARTALHGIQTHLKRLESEHNALAENVTKLRGKNLELEAQVEKFGVGDQGEQTPLSEID